MDGLREIIIFGGASYSIDDLQRFIKDNFRVTHDYKTVWTIVRKKFGLNYGNHYKILYTSKDVEEHLKKLRKDGFST